jgi:hypothetical protein
MRTRIRARGLDAVPKHDWLPLALDGHSVFGVSMHLFSGVADDFTSAGRQVDLQVSLIHS